MRFFGIEANFLYAFYKFFNYPKQFRLYKSINLTNNKVNLWDFYLAVAGNNIYNLERVVEEKIVKQKLYFYHEMCLSNICWIWNYIYLYAKANQTNRRYQTIRNKLPFFHGIFHHNFDSFCVFWLFVFCVSIGGCWDYKHQHIIIHNT